MGQALAIGAQVTAAPPAPPPPPPPPPPPLAPQAHILAGAEDPPLPPPPDPGSDGPSVLGDAPVSGVVRRRRSISMEGSKR
jgi:cytokinesis protein